MSAISEQLLRAAAPENKALAPWVEPIKSACDRFKVKDIAAFLAQNGHESAGFTRLVESLNYSTAERIQATWPKRFPTVASARPYVRNAQELANLVYGGRMGNTDPNDGWTYRGRGLIQLTGKANYQAFADAIKRPLGVIPLYLMTNEGASLAAGWCWATNKLDGLSLEAQTRNINGGLNGLKDRQERYQRCLKILGS